MGKKKWKSEDWVAQFIAAALEKVGVDLYDDFLGSFSIFRLRILGSTLQFGIQEHFDRWANSVDFEFEVKQCMLGDIDARIQAALIAAHLEVRTKNFSDGWGQCAVINLRQAQRLLREKSFEEIIAELT